MVVNFQKLAKKEPRKDLSSKASASTSKKKSKDSYEDGKKKMQKKKKDPNAPKSVLFGFRLFSQKEREVCFMLYIPVAWKLSLFFCKIVQNY